MADTGRLDTVLRTLRQRLLTLALNWLMKILTGSDGWLPFSRAEFLCVVSGCSQRAPLFPHHEAVGFCDVSVALKGTGLEDEAHS